MAGQDYARCRSCNARIEFALNPVTGKRVPINPVSETSQKDVNARWAVWDNPNGGWFARPVTIKEPFNEFDEHLVINHFAVCVRSHVPASRKRRVPARSR